MKEKRLGKIDGGIRMCKCLDVGESDILGGASGPEAVMLMLSISMLVWGSRDDDDLLQMEGVGGRLVLT